MKIISELADYISEELESAEEYAIMAVQYKEEHPGLAKVLYDISLQEMNHVEMLHNEVVAIIEKHRREHGEPPTPMMAVYDYLHKRDIEWATKIKLLQNQYRGV